MRWSHSTQAQSTASHCRLTSPTGDYSRMHSKVSSYWLPSYIKVTPSVLEIFKMAGYFPDSPRKCTERNQSTISSLILLSHSFIRMIINYTEACNTYSMSKLLQTDAMNLVENTRPSIRGMLK